MDAYLVDNFVVVNGAYWVALFWQAFKNGDHVSIFF